MILDRGLNILLDPVLIRLFEDLDEICKGKDPRWFNLELASTPTELRFEGESYEGEDMDLSARSARSQTGDMLHTHRSPSK